MLTNFRGLVMTRRQRMSHCRRDGHQWTEMAYPPACSQCGRTQAIRAADHEPLPEAA